MECDQEKPVDFYTYCKKCKYENNPEEKDPCDECMLHFTNTNSYKPVLFEEKEK